MAALSSLALKFDYIRIYCGVSIATAIPVPNSKFLFKEMISLKSLASDMRKERYAAIE